MLPEAVRGFEPLDVEHALELVLELCPGQGCDDFGHCDPSCSFVARPPRPGGAGRGGRVVSADPAASA